MSDGHLISTDGGLDMLSDEEAERHDVCSTCGTAEGERARTYAFASVCDSLSHS